MRDPNRIPEVIAAQEEAWRKNPDLRLGQLIVVATHMIGRDVVCPEIFSIEDGPLLKGFRQCSANADKNEKK
jgi:hypothetical protein